MTAKQEQEKTQMIQQLETAYGRYTNLTMIRHSAEDFIIDFVFKLPETSILVSRVVLSPGHTKRLIEALAKDMGKYEDQFGEVVIPHEP